MGILAAPAYSRYLKRCQRAYRPDSAGDPAIVAAARQFDEQGFATLWTPDTQALAESLMTKLADEEKRDAGIWDADGRYAAAESYARFPELEGFLTGDLGDLYRAIYQAHFKIYYTVIYRSEHAASGPSGSQLWHADGGPGTCINTMIYLTDVGPDHGALDCLPWSETLEIFRRERRALRGLEKPDERLSRAAYYRDEIENHYADRVVRPTGKAGLVVVFRNNLIHKGGFPAAGVTRYVSLFHAYASHKPTQFDRYRVTGTPKRGPYPVDPAEDF